MVNWHADISHAVSQIPQSMIPLQYMRAQVWIITEYQLIQ